MNATKIKITKEKKQAIIKACEDHIEKSEALREDVVKVLKSASKLLHMRIFDKEIVENNEKACCAILKLVWRVIEGAIQHDVDWIYSIREAKYIFGHAKALNPETAVDYQQRVDNHLEALDNLVYEAKELWKATTRVENAMDNNIKLCRVRRVDNDVENDFGLAISVENEAWDLYEKVEDIKEEQCNLSATNSSIPTFSRWQREEWASKLRYKKHNEYVCYIKGSDAYEADEHSFINSICKLCEDTHIHDIAFHYFKQVLKSFFEYHKPHAFHRAWVEALRKNRVNAKVIAHVESKCRLS